MLNYSTSSVLVCVTVRQVSNFLICNYMRSSIIPIHTTASTCIALSQYLALHISLISRFGGKGYKKAIFLCFSSVWPGKWTFLVTWSGPWIRKMGAETAETTGPRFTVWCLDAGGFPHTHWLKKLKKKTTFRQPESDLILLGWRKALSISLFYNINTTTKAVQRWLPKKFLFWEVP